jgi:hypothetical protein
MFGKDELGKLFGEDLNRTQARSSSGSSAVSTFVPSKDLVKKPEW